MKLREYRTFISIVEQQSLSRAANQLHLSTSTVSKQLARLEEDLEATLVDRNTQSFAVTPLGMEFYDRCKQIILSIDEAEQSVRDRLTRPTGKLSIALPEVLLQTELPEHLADFARHYPSVKFNLSITNETEDLIESHSDFAFRIEPLTDERLIAFPLMTTHLVAVASTSFIKSNGHPHSLADLVANHELVLPSYVNIPRISRLLGNVVGDEPVSFEASHSATSEAAILRMVRSGMGVAMLLDVSVAEMMRNGTLVNLFPDEQFLSRTICLVWRAKHHVTRTHTLFKEFIRSRYADSERAYLSSLMVPTS